jgi:hypothetical protein
MKNVIPGGASDSHRDRASGSPRLAAGMAERELRRRAIGPPESGVPPPHTTGKVAAPGWA